MNELAVRKENGGALQASDPAAVAAATAAKARIESAYVIAMNRPRDVDQARDRILHACRRPVFAERVEFSKPVGGRRITGPSIRFAELALREWGNILSDVQVVYEDENIRRTRVLVVDLETNASFSKEIQIPKVVERKSPKDRDVVTERTNTLGEKVFVVRATDEELHNKEAAAVSKAIRNEGLRVIPSDIIDEALDVARATLRDRDKKDPDAAKKAVLDAFSEIGIRPRDVQLYLKHATDQMTPAEMQDLRGIYRAIRDGEAKWSDFYQPASEIKASLDQLKDKVKKISGKAAPAKPAPEPDVPESIEANGIEVLEMAPGRMSGPSRQHDDGCLLF